MNRWFGTSQDSQQQASERASRAARRTIASQVVPLVLSDSEDEYRDCNTSNSNIFGGLDGADDIVDDDDMSQAELAAQAELTRQRALPVDESDFDNDPDS